MDTIDADLAALLEGVPEAAVVAAKEETMNTEEQKEITVPPPQPQSSSAPAQDASATVEPDITLSSTAPITLDGFGVESKKASKPKGKTAAAPGGKKAVSRRGGVSFSCSTCSAKVSPAATAAFLKKMQQNPNLKVYCMACWIKSEPPVRSIAAGRYGCCPDASVDLGDMCFTCKKCSLCYHPACVNVHDDEMITHIASLKVQSGKGWVCPKCSATDTSIRKQLYGNGLGSKRKR